MIFYQNAYFHWQSAIKGPQDPRPAPEPSRFPTPTTDTRTASRKRASSAQLAYSPKLLEVGFSDVRIAPAQHL
jgi:hypothetical protein